MAIYKGTAGRVIFNGDTFTIEIDQQAKRPAKRRRNTSKFQLLSDSLADSGPYRVFDLQEWVMKNDKT